VKNTILPKEEVVKVLQQVHQIVIRRPELGTRLIYEERGNEYDNRDRWLSELGFQSKDVLNLLDHLKVEDYHNSTIVGEKQYLHSFLIRIDKRYYVKFEFVILGELDEDVPTISLVSFHPPK
jgi:hypothetical protein